MGILPPRLTGDARTDAAALEIYDLHMSAFMGVMPKPPGWFYKKLNKQYKKAKRNKRKD